MIKKIFSYYYLLRFVFRVYFLNTNLAQKRNFFKLLRARYWPANRQSSPMSVIFGVTYKCQNKCVHCAMANYQINKQEELNLEEIEKILGEFAENGFQDISLFGGEPLMRSGLNTIINLAARKGMVLHLDTNGIGLKEKIQGLKKAGLSHVFISLDSDKEEIHDKLRGNRGCYREVINAIEECKRLKFPFTVATYATKEDEGDYSRLKNIIKIAKKNNAVGVRIVTSVLSGNWLHKEELRINDQQRKTIEKLLDGFVYLETPSNLSSSRICLSLRRKLIYVSPYGDVQPCAYTPIAFGNLRNERLSIIIKRMWKHEIFDFAYKEDECIANHPEFIKKYASILNEKNNLIQINETSA